MAVLIVRSHNDPICAALDVRLKAFDFAEETTKQLITLAVAILTLTITFVDDLIGELDGWPKYLLGATWILNILSMMAGLGTLGALTWELEPKKEPEKDPGAKATDHVPSIQNRDVVRSAQAQVLLFIAGMTCLVVFGIATYW